MGKIFKILHRFTLILITNCVVLLFGCAPHYDSSNLTFSNFGNIALLLPLEGPLSKQAKAIRNGFFAAYYQMKQSKAVPSIILLNTADKNILSVYQQAVDQGANFIVGPLTKNNLVTLINSNAITIPTLALNSLPSDDFYSNYLFQFGLSPIDEAKQVASKMWNDQRREIILITPAGSWGEAITLTFQKEWKSLGGKIIAHLTYKKDTNLNNAIQKLLNIDKAEKRAAQINQLLHKKVRFIARRRQDFDAIFFVANAKQAKQIVPLLRFYYAGNVPLYSTSSVYSSSSHADNDIDGVIFNDMPWTLAPELLPLDLQITRNQIRTIWPDFFNENARLYALGVDAFNIIHQLRDLYYSSEHSINGATGILYLSPNQRIYRQLIWVKIVNGQPTLL